MSCACVPRTKETNLTPLPLLLFRWTLFTVVACVFPGPELFASAKAPRPNIVLILADDLGWADLACYGGDLVETPRLDALAQDGMRFTQAYAMSVCSPTRAMLLTGRHAARLGMTIWIEGSLQRASNRRLIEAESRHDLPPTETSLATLLRGAGYLTALVGKWHLGDGNHYPETHGFDVNIGGTHWGAPTTFWWPYSGAGRFGSQYRYVPHLEFGNPGEYLTDRLTDEALRVIEQAEGRPFFLLLSHHSPHTPIEAKASDVQHFERKLRPGLHHGNPVYAAMVKSLDEGVGRVLDRLQERGLADNTIVIFTSDNGGYTGIDRKSGRAEPVTSNFPLRSGKGSLYEGGIRVPLIVRWPGVARAGAECRSPVSLADVFATLVETAAVKPTAKSDGIDLTSVLRDPAARLNRDALYFHYPHYYETTTPVSAVRVGDWKLLEFYEDSRLELFNLAEDPGEASNLAAREPAKAAELHSRLDHWRREVGARLPAANTAFRAKK